jgi:hypothetical protein
MCAVAGAGLGLHWRMDMRQTFLGSGLLTAGALLLVYAAFDDITTDNATSFTVEYSFLAVCGAWLLFLATRLLAARRRVLGSISIAALAVALWSQATIGLGLAPGRVIPYVAFWIAFLWFWIVSATLLYTELRPRLAA